MSRDPRRIRRICDELATLWESAPDQRFCQLLVNIGVLEQAKLGGVVESGLVHDPFHTEDEAVEVLIRQAITGGQ